MPSIPLFPLSSVVLFPGCDAPLHLFESRYLQMMRDALEGERVIGMIAVRPEATEDMAGDPPVYPVGCVGRIASHERLADGRYNLVLRGTHRFSIEREIPREGERLYRIAETLSLPEPSGTLDRALELREAVVGHLAAFAERASGATKASTEEATRAAFEQLAELGHATFVNRVCQMLGVPTAEKQGLLEAPDLGERLVRLEGLLAFHRAAIGTAGLNDPSTIH